MTMMIPKHCASLASLTDAEASNRLAFGGVYVSQSPERLRIAASNARYLGLVDFPSSSLPSADDLPTLPALESAPNGGTSAIVPAEAWFSSLKRISKRPANPSLACAALKSDGKNATLASWGKDGPFVIGPVNCDGRFPDIEPIIPTGEGITVTLDVDMLVTLLKVSSDYTSDDRGRIHVRIPWKSVNNGEGQKKVDLTVTGAIVIENPEEQHSQYGRFRGVIMPICR